MPTLYKEINIAYGKFLKVISSYNPSIANVISSSSFDETTIPNMSFNKISESNNRPTIATKFTDAHPLMAYNTGDLDAIARWLSLENKFSLRRFTPSNMQQFEDIEEYVFVPINPRVNLQLYRTYRDTICFYKNPYNNIFSLPKVFGRTSNGTFTEIQGAWERYDTPISCILEYSYDGGNTWQYPSTFDRSTDSILPPMDDSNFRMFYMNEFDIGSSAKWFTSEATARNYLIDGDDSGEIGGDTEEITPERNKSTLYLKATVYRSTMSTRTQAEKVESHKWEFDVLHYNDDGTEISKWNRGVIGFVNDNINTGHYNLGFMENTATKNLLEIRKDGTKIDKNSFPWITPQTTYTENTKDVIEDQAYFYWSVISTNMYIFDTLAHAQQVIQGIEEGIVKMFEGDDLTNTHLNDNDLDFNTDMSDCFVLDQADVQALARRFNAYVTSDGSIISDLFVGLGIHENPIDCNIDLFEMPIDVSGFCETEHYIVKFSPRVTRNPDPERQPEE